MTDRRHQLARPAAGMALAILASCTVYDGRSLSIERRGEAIAVDEVLPIRVRASQGIRSVELVAGGTVLGRYPTNQDVDADVSRVPPGERILEARADDGAYQSASARLEFRVDHPRVAVLGIDPPPGAVEPKTPFVVEVRLSRPVAIEADPTGPLVSFRDAEGRLIPVEHVLADGGRTLRVTVTSLWEGGGFLYAGLRDEFGRPGAVSEGAWSARIVTYDLLVDSWGRNSVTLSPSATWPSGIDPPAEAALWAGPYLVADLGRPPWAQVVWDVRGIPEGSYPLRVEVPEWLARTPRGFEAHVDRTSPVVTCPSASGELDVAGPLVIAASEPIANARPKLLADGVPFMEIFPPESWSGETLRPESPPNPPWTFSLSLGPSAADRAGNPPVLNGCTLAAPVWVAPWGAGPLAATAPVIASRLALHVESEPPPVSSGGRRLGLGWIAAPPGSDEGPLRVYRRVVGESQPDVELTPRARSVSVSRDSSSRDRVAWIDTSSAPARALSAYWDFPAGTWRREVALNAEGREASDVVLAPCHPFPCGSLFAWTEDDGAGGRTIRAMRSPSGADLSRPPRVEGDPRSDPAAVADHSAVSSDGLMAFLETLPAACLGFAWSRRRAGSRRWNPSP